MTLRQAAICLENIQIRRYNEKAFLANLKGAKIELKTKRKKESEIKLSDDQKVFLEKAMNEALARKQKEYGYTK